MSATYVCRHRHPKRSMPLPTEELAERTLTGLARCWTLLDRIEAEWEGRAAPAPVSEWDIFAAISRVREQERQLAMRAASMRRYRARRKAKGRTECAR